MTPTSTSTSALLSLIRSQPALEAEARAAYAVHWWPGACAVLSARIPGLTPDRAGALYRRLTQPLTRAEGWISISKNSQASRSEQSPREVGPTWCSRWRKTRLAIHWAQAEIATIRAESAPLVAALAAGARIA